MRIITWNVNGLRAITAKGAFDQFLAEYDPDVLLLQETKGKQDALQPVFDQYALDYKIFHNAAEKPGYSGTTIFLKQKYEDVSFVADFPNYNCSEGRVVRVDLGQHTIFGVYFPNGGKSPEAWEEKLKFYDAFLEHVNQLRGAGRTVIWGGDVNCCHTEIDIARPKENDGKVGFHPRERAWIDRCIAAGWTDIWRSNNPDTRDQYSWWTYRGGAREKNVGWRIDYFFADQDFSPNVTKINYLNEQLGSDHCPLLLEFL